MPTQTLEPLLILLLTLVFLGLLADSGPPESSLIDQFSSQHGIAVAERGDLQAPEPIRPIRR